MPALTKFIFTSFLILTSIWCYGQDYTVAVVPLEEDDGLVGNRVSKMLQDQNGFVWMSTQDGVVRYDGHHFQWFNKTNSGLRDIPKSKQLAEDADGYMWFNYETKIDLMHRSTFEVIHFEDKFKAFKSDKFLCKKIAGGSNGTVFFQLRENGLLSSYKYHPEVGIKKLAFLKNYRIMKTKGNVLWALNKETWIKYDLKTGKPLKKAGIGKIFKNIKIISSEKDYFTGLSGNDFVIFEVFKKDYKELIRIPNIKGRSLFRNDRVFYDANNQIFFFLIKDEVRLFNLEGGKLIPFQSYSKDEIQPFSKVFLTDDQGVIWGIRSSEKGKINLVKTTPSKFKQYSPLLSVKGIWLNQKYLFYNKYQIPLANPQDFAMISESKGVHSVENNITDELWQGHFDGIVNVYSEDGTSHPPILHSSEINKDVKLPLWSILRDTEGRWWGGSGTKGVLQNGAIHQDSLYKFKKYNGFNELKKSTILHLMEDGDYIWSASNTGLHLIHKKNGVEQRYASNLEKNYQLPIDNAHFVYKDKENIYWVATNADGLVRFELDSDKRILNYKTYTIEDGLSSNVLYTIVEDDKDRLWISTLHGLSCFNRKTEQIQAFFELDGLPETEFNRISYAKGEDGRIYFGTINGVISFHPDEVIKKDIYKRPLVITKFEKFEKRGEELTEKTQELQETNKIRLLPSDQFMRLSVSLMDYFNTKKVRYAYKIDGLFKDFQFIEGNTIEIGRLPYGNYKLIVKGQGADRRFSTQELVIPLTVVRPFYLKWWFIVLLIVILVVSGAQLYFWRVRLLEDRKKELELMVKERTAKIEKQSIQLKERTAKIEEQSVKLKELDKLKSNFFANISHELRTPLTLILAPLGNLFKIKQLSNKEHTQIMMMEQNGQKLLKRINELLDLSRLDANKLEVKEQAIFLYPFFKTLLSTFESTSNIKDIQLLFDFQLNEDLQVLLDDDKAEKIISNFLSNALKFTPKNGTITLKIYKQENYLRISVKDTGVGIPADELPKIFDRFYQVKNNQHQGTGIGLSLCQELARTLKGQVWVTSEIGHGSTFYLELPLIETFAIKEKVEIEALEILPLAAEPVSSNANILRSNILIIEDNPDLRAFLTLILEDQYNVSTAENGQDALDQLKTVEPSLVPSLILSDIMMPVMDGIEFLTQIKASDKWCHIPVIMLTARKSLEVKLEVLRIGVDDYLTKPFTNEELIARISNLITNSKSRLSISPEEASQEALKVSTSDLKWIKKVEEIILENIEDANFTISDLSKFLNISSTHTRRKIKQITGLSPKQYERSIKLAKARDLLKSGEFRTVSEVLYRLGFENHYYFSKIYKQAYGVMPTEELS